MKINISQNPASEGEYAISEIFSMLPQVEFVNSFNKNGNKEELSSEEEDDEDNVSDEESEEEESEEEEEN